MRNKYEKQKKNLSYYAKIIFAIAITLLIYGAILDISNSKRLYDPVEDVTTEEQGTINITTSDDSEVIPGNTTKSNTNSADTVKDSSNNSSDNSTNEENTSNSNTNSSNTNSNANSSNNSGNNSSNNSSQNTQNYNQNTQSNTQHIPTLDETNDNLRKSIQDTYGITIKYGSETEGYTVAGISTTPVYNSTTINANLNRMATALSLYPSGFFAEIKNGGIPLTIMLINNYAQNSITGVTDSSYSYAVISIATAYSFEESFYHESYHYIERYMLKKGLTYSNWNSLNPGDFSYGTLNYSYSYTSTYSQDASFVNAYAMTSEEEDRASTFEYMMASSKAVCLNNGTTIWKKAKLISEGIDAAYNTVSPNVTEYWERFL